MAIINLNTQSQLIALGNRNDSCFLCTAKIQAKDEREYGRKLHALKGVLEGKKTVKIRRGGTETVVCMKCIHEIAKENPIEK